MDYKALSRKHFNRQAVYYDEKATTTVSKFPKMCYAFCEEELQRYHAEKLLDLGCGTGEMIRLLREKHPQMMLWGLDLSPEMIRRAKEKQIPHADFCVGDAEFLPYPDQSFDVVLCMQSFHHYPNPEAVLEEVYRVLRPGGRFLLYDMYVKNRWMRALENRFLLKWLRMGDVHTYGRSEICHLMEKQGFFQVYWNQIHPVMFFCKGKKP